MKENLSMAPPLIFTLILSSILTAAAAQQRQFNVSLGSSLSPTKNSSWLSPSGLYAFGFYPQANNNGYAIGIFVAGIPQKTIVWTANRDDPPVSDDVTLFLTRDSGLVLQSAQGENTEVISATQSVSSAAIFDSGNFVLYNSDQEIIWQSFDHPTDALLQTQRLKAGTQLFSSVSETDKSTGIFRLAMQTDGNLVQYPADTSNSAENPAYWASGTAERGDNVTLNLDPDGHLYLLNSTGFNILNLSPARNPTNETIYMMKIDADGIFRLYLHNGTHNGDWVIAWSSTNDKCRPKGLCGLNGYCVLNDQQAECKCLPGFAAVNPGNWASGCERNFAAESCKEENISTRYTIRELANTRWEEASYVTLSLASKEDCAQACRDDCNCEAAFFRDRQCRKQRLPLRYGRRDLTNTNSAFIKVGMSIPFTDVENRIEPRDERSKKNVRKEILIGSVSCVASVLAMLAIFAIVIRKYHVQAYKKISNYDKNPFYEQVSLQSFTYAELEEVTNGFQEEIGRGAFGTVYKGLISKSRKVVAVKRLDGVLAEGEREFQTEIQVIAKTHHKNLVCLLGYCIDGPNRLLVYEYMSNGSLANVLFSPEKRPTFVERLEIARNVARGILYLHEECETQIIHCDIKPQNILMDDHRCPKISDFGLAKLMKPDQTKTFTGIRGTKGYVAPEWHRNLPVTVKVDVYSFGVVLLEIICCRRNVDHSLPETEAILEEWVYNCFEAGELQKLVGEEEADMGQLDRLVKVGIWCTLDEPSLRPSMKKVLLMLEGTVDIPAPPSPTSFLTAM